MNSEVNGSLNFIADESFVTIMNSNHLLCLFDVGTGQLVEIIERHPLREVLEGFCSVFSE